jgi:hypothetical protein
MNATGALRVLADPTPVGHFPPGSEYASRVWLPVVGPASWTTWQVLVRNAELHPAGWTTSLEELSALVGLGSSKGNQSGIARALRRLDRFGIVRPVAVDRLVVRRQLPYISPGQLDRLPAVVQAVHQRLHDSHVRRRHDSPPIASVVEAQAG